ncbi:hypothetical protein [Sinimarinibacterium sp. NLF-5-8]|uniref:hypothetical protein n=1 Tax=Sinimarinibacterium sp. NLF-5-8 TaxID=2698684 RepID=UPI00137BEFA7|nr:hypothetical protein [Sinimarinibacterium sp. NLF-5-8]QHS09055.1 hypothetical protein GT972_02105 [Sinimarinibacterium sp. NLF-5-8]
MSHIQVFESFEKNPSFRLQEMFYLAATLAGEAESAGELVEMLERGGARAFADMPEDVLYGDGEAIVKWLIEHRKFGFLARFDVDMKYQSKDKTGVWRFFRQGWVYGETMGEVLAMVFEKCTREKNQ